VSTIRVRAGDVLVLATDGIDNDFTSSVELDREPQPLADFILARHAKSTDDALVFVARFGRGSP
jgi:negative regulator of sigma-B (phosphoserine phosphatase)